MTKPYEESQVKIWYEDYKKCNLTVVEVAKKNGVKHSTMLRQFRKLGLELRGNGFRQGNYKGKYGEDSERARYVWFYTHAYKRRANKKNMPFEITAEEFIKIVTSNCIYCGKSYLEETRRVHKEKIPMLTVDRLDSKKGYIDGNCVAACKTCNIMKLNQPLHEWLDKMKKILDYFPNNKQGIA